MSSRDHLFNETDGTGTSEFYGQLFQYSLDPTSPSAKRGSTSELTFQDLFVSWTQKRDRRVLRVAPAIAQLNELKQMTGWSNRALGKGLHCSHTHVQNILKGHDVAGDVAFVNRVRATHDLISRLWDLVDQDRSALLRLLETRPKGARKSAQKHLESADFRKAYVSALDVHNAGSDDLLDIPTSEQNGEATVAFLDESKEGEI